MSGQPWFRLYAEMASDAKIQMLAFEDQRHYVMLLCLECNGTLNTTVTSDAHRERLIAKALGLDTATAAEVKRRLIEGGLVGTDWHPIKWDSRQFKSDHDSAERKRNQRARERERDSHNDVTTDGCDSHGLEQIQNRTDTESDTEQTRILEFLDFKVSYPARAGDQGWINAQKYWNRNIERGNTAQQMVDGAKRYATYLAAIGGEGTQYVKKASSFLDPHENLFLNDWTPPASKADRRLDSNVESMNQFLNEG